MRSVAEEANVTCGSRQSWVVFKYFLFFYDPQVCVQYDHSVERHRNALSVSSDFLFIPLAQRLSIACTRGEHVVNRAVVLLRSDHTFVPRVSVIQNLDLHSLIGRIAFPGCTNPDSVIGSRRQQKFESEGEIAIFLLREKIAASLFRADDLSSFHQITGSVTADQFPSVQRLAIEKRFKTRLIGPDQCACKQGQNQKSHEE